MDHKLYNLKKLDDIAQGDEGFIWDMLITFVENVSSDIAGIQSYKLTESWISIAETAHKLASNFAYLGSERLHALAIDIEKSVILDRNLIGVAEKADKLCAEGTLLVNQLKKDFNIADPN